LQAWRRTSVELSDEHSMIIILLLLALIVLILIVL